MNAYYTKYNPTIFNAADYPEMVEELAKLCKGIRFMPGYGKVEATISFLRDHRIKTEWIKTNPILIDFIRSNAYKSNHIESLFELSRGNAAFLSGFENYIDRTVQGKQ